MLLIEFLLGIMKFKKNYLFILAMCGEVYFTDERYFIGN